MKKKVRNNTNNSVILAAAIAVVLAGVFILPLVLAIEPTGSSVTEVRSETAPNDTAQSDDAVAGNVTELTLFAYSTTRSWQGYFGNVSGTIQLADNSDNVLYNWSLADPEGEVYASTNVSINWTNIQCFNFTAAGTHANDVAQAGATSLFGTNLSILETEFNISSDNVDGVNETFTLSGAGTHDLFYTGNREFTEGECLSTRVFGDSGQGESNEFEEVLLYEPTSSSVVYAALLEETSVLGFDGSDYDFEMLVLEDGQGTDTATTTYYFFVELE